MACLSVSLCVCLWLRILIVVWRTKRSEKGACQRNRCTGNACTLRPTFFFLAPFFIRRHCISLSSFFFAVVVCLLFCFSFRRLEAIKKEDVA